MRYKQLGQSDIQVSEACLGTMYFGTTVDEKNAFQVLDAFIDRGGNFIDTANNYCYWNGKGMGDESELLISKWLKARNNRSDIILASKIGARPELPEMTNPSDANFKLEGLRKETIIKAVEDSLRRLDTDYLDLCYIHADLEAYPLEERWEALHQLETSGKIRLKGCSNYKPDRLAESENVGRQLTGNGSHALQQKMSYLLPANIDPNGVLRFVDDAIVDYVEEHQLSLLTYSVLLSGAYEKGYDTLPNVYFSEQNKAKFERVLSEAEQQGITPSQWVLREIQATSKQIIPLVAASSLKQLSLNLDAFS